MAPIVQAAVTIAGTVLVTVLAAWLRQELQNRRENQIKFGEVKARLLEVQAAPESVQVDKINEFTRFVVSMSGYLSETQRRHINVYKAYTASPQSVRITLGPDYMAATQYLFPSLSPRRRWTGRVLSWVAGHRKRLMKT